MLIEERRYIVTSLRNFLITFLIAFLVFGLCAYYITDFLTDSMNDLMSGDKVEETVTTADVGQNHDSNIDNVVDTLKDLQGESFNILLVGTDYRPSLYNDYHPNISSQYPTFTSSKKLTGYNGDLPEYPYRTVSADAIVLVCVNEEKRTVACVNIPGEMYIEYAGGQTLLGDLYYEKGFEVFKTKISALTGADIHYYALTSVEQVANVVDKIGPVTYNVPCNMEYRDEDNGLTISVAAGQTAVNGKTAADLLSFNSYVGNDNSRAKTTLSFLVALAKKMTNPANLANASSIFKSIDKYIYTNVETQDLTNNLELVFSLSSFEFVQMEYPATPQGGGRYAPNTGAAISNISKYVAD